MVIHGWSRVIWSAWSICMYASMYACIHVCMCMYLRVACLIYICMYINIYFYAYMMYASQSVRTKVATIAHSALNQRERDGQGIHWKLQCQYACVYSLLQALRSLDLRRIIFIWFTTDVCNRRWYFTAWLIIAYTHTHINLENILMWNNSLYNSCPGAKNEAVGARKTKVFVSVIRSYILTDT